MSNRKTVAIIGLAEDDGIVLAAKIPNEKTILLFDRDVSLVNKAYLKMRSKGTNTTLEKMTCAINACWEADVIVLSNYYSLQDKLIAQITKVATGKTILLLMGKKKEKIGNKISEKAVDLFPFSKVIFVFTSDNDTDEHFYLEENNEFAMQTKLTFFTNCGF